MCNQMSHEDRIFNAAVKLLAHKDITVDRAVRQAIELWDKVLDLQDDIECTEIEKTGNQDEDYDALADESVDDLPTTELLSRGFMNVAELDKRQLPLDF